MGLHYNARSESVIFRCGVMGNGISRLHDNTVRRTSQWRLAALRLHFSVLVIANPSLIFADRAILWLAWLSAASYSVLSGHVLPHTVRAGAVYPSPARYAKLGITL